MWTNSAASGIDMQASKNLLEHLPLHATVMMDTAPVIYMLDGNTEFLPKFLPLFRAAERGELQILLTPVTLAEVLAGPLKARKEALAERYESALREGLGWRVVDLTADIAAKAARLRIRYGLKLADAFQLAAALTHSVAALVTHDRDFGRAGQEVPILGA
jgi:predicted nucleic acid-binding protein